MAGTSAGRLDATSTPWACRRPRRVSRRGIGPRLPRSIQGTLLLLLLVALVPVLLVQAGIYYNSFKTRRAQELQANLELARAVAATFEAYVQDILRQEVTI